MNRRDDNRFEAPFLEQGAAAECPAVMNALAVGMICCALDEDLTFIWGNSCFFASTGYSSETYEQLFPNLRQYFHGCPEAFTALKNEAQAAAASGAKAITLTLRLPRNGGQFSWMRLNGTITTAEDGPVLKAVLTDVGDLVCQKEEQARLHEQKRQYFTWMLDAYGGNIYVSDMENYELLYLNQSSCDTLGMPAKKLLGKKCYEVIQGRTSPCPFCTNNQLREDAFYDWEFYNPILKRTFMIKNRIINWQGRKARIELSHDMYSAEYKLAKKDRERDALIRSIPGCFTRLDARDFRTILWYGADFLDIIEYSAEQFEDELDRQIGFVHPEDWARILPKLKETTATGENFITEARLITRSGKIKILTVTFCYASEADSWDGIASFYSIGLEVTKEREEQIRQRQALEDAYESARVANDAKSNFLSSMSHDIRTPINAIMGMAIIAQANLSTPEKVHDCLEKINVSSKHLLSLINEILDMSKIESGKIDLVSEMVELPVLLQNVMDMCQPLVDEKKQNFQVDAVMVQHEKVITDSGRLQQVFVNLLSNAIKYTPEGGNIHLRIQEVPSVIESKAQFEIVVADDGIGMTEDFVEHIFEPFTRAEDSRISKIQGTGLGLTITENIVQMMNGTIGVKSVLGKGSQFTVALPLEIDALEARKESSGLEGLAVLVVDDDAMICENTVALLAELGMRGYWALSGQEAVQRIVDAHAESDDFFAIIVDWKMPGLDGLDTVKAIREKLGLDAPILIVSAYDYSEIEAEFRQAGANAFITKPLFKSKILQVFQTFCCSLPPDSALALPQRQLTSLAGKHILLVEDNDLNREIAVELLQMYGLTVAEAENGQQAVDMFLANAPETYDGILMDIQMPVLNGYEATKAIRALKRPDAQVIPILALTANAFASDLGKAHNAGMNDYIAKPIDVEQLLGVMQKWIGNRD